MRFTNCLTILLVGVKLQQCASDSLFQRVARFATGKGDTYHDDLVGIPTTNLSNGVKIPLVGLGVGNMAPEVIPAIIAHGLKSDKNIRLIDTSNVSSNEILVAQGIVEGVEQLKKVTGQSLFEVHVITKVWYTHLGYNRTLAAVKSSLEALKEAVDHPSVSLKVHAMLHWPRCYDTIPWMNCELEEENLSDEIKKAGPPPHLDKENAWKESWKALEELVSDKSNQIVSIGVSNFHLNELDELTKLAKVKPHIIETNAWSLLYDPLLVEFCHKKGIHLVAYNLMDGIIRQEDAAPYAYHHLLVISNEFTKIMRAGGLLSADQEVTPAQVVLTWLIQHSISVIPRTTDLYHLKENSATSLVAIPAMNDDQVQTVAHSVEALISGEDLTEDAFVKLTFHAKSKDVFLYWHDPDYGGEIQVAKIEKGKSFEESTHPGHVFRIYDSEAKDNLDVFTVSGKYGDHRHVEL
jgi:diketogulonate reductase-like aldo/keto reductase